MLTSFGFAIDKTYPTNFPKALDFEEDDHLSFQTPLEAFKAAQKEKIPYFAVVVVESTAKSDDEENEAKKYYHVYDMSFFETYRTNEEARILAKSKLEEGKKIEPEDLIFTDPVSREKVTKIHYFAVKCFEPDVNLLFRPTDPTEKPINLEPFSPLPQEVTNKMFKDALNVNLSLKGDDKAKSQMRRIQYILADFIKKGSIFADLKDKKQETLLWLWCSAHGSHRGVVNLFHEYAAQQEKAIEHPVIQEFMLKTKESWNSQLPRQEREAIQEAIRLLKKVEDLKA